MKFLAKIPGIKQQVARSALRPVDRLFSGQRALFQHFLIAEFQLLLEKLGKVHLF